MTANLSTKLYAVGIAAEAMKGSEPTTALIEAATIAIATQALLAADPAAEMDRLLGGFCRQTRRLANVAGGQPLGDTP